MLHLPQSPLQLALGAEIPHLIFFRLNFFFFFVARFGLRDHTRGRKALTAHK
jgi:hypothetical protein